MNETISKYRVLGVLGQGAMGRVLRAEDPHIGREVAIKVMTLSDDTSHERFQREARIVGGLSHPNIVVVYDFGFHDDKPFLVMELLDGTDLKRWMASPHRLGEQLRIMAGLCAAVTHAHDRGVLHRDIKPGNVQVLPSGQCKLMDFGIARGEVSDLTATGTVMGTPTYMAPEILGNHPPSMASDIYAVGMICYEMLTGSNPFVRDSLAACLNAVLTVTPRHLGECRPDLPHEFADAVMRCIEKDPGYRAADLHRLAAAVEAASAAGTGGEAPPPDMEAETGATVVVDRDRTATGSRIRGRLLLAVLAAALLVVVVGVGYRSGFWSAGPEQVPAAVPTKTPVAGPVGGHEPTYSADAPTTQGNGIATPAATGHDGPQPAVSFTPLRPSPTPKQPAAAHQQPIRPTATATVALPRPTAAPTSTPTVPPTAIPRPTRRVEPAPTAAPALELAEPELSLSSVEPSSVRLGASVHLRLVGNGFGAGITLEVLRGRRPADGFRVLNLNVVDSTHAEADLLVDDDIPLGRYAIVVVGAGGDRSGRVELDVNL